jgi:putative endopeptidase
MKTSLKLFLVTLAVAMVSFAPPGKKQKAKRKFIDPANMDLSVKPGDNFYLYANGNWIKKNPVPPSKTTWGSFLELREESSKKLRTLLEEAMAGGDKNPRAEKIGNFFRSGMDSITIEKKGYTPIQQDLQRIHAIKDINGILDEIANQRNEAIASSILAISVGQDRKNVTQHVPQVSQSGTSLPDRDYYLKNDARSLDIRNKYKVHLAKMFALIGKSSEQAEKAADAIMRIETALAKAQMTRVELRDPYKTYNKFAWKDLSASTPSIDWKQLAEKMKVRNADSIIVTNPTYLQTLDILLTALPVEEWKTYLEWNVLKNAAPYLSDAFVKQSFSFDQVLSGQKEIAPRWQRMSGLIDASLGDDLGQLYVEKYFKPEARKRMQDLVENLHVTFAERIKRLDWMSAETKERALQKLNAFTKKIAYPDKWKDYSTVTISKDDLLGNIRRSGKWAYNDMVERIGKPVDKTEWRMTPPTVNAYYSPVNNEIAFPAAILQFPFFDFEADDAVNYGGIGAVIGHEITHGFDDTGRQYAAEGNLKDWWTKEDTDKFKQKADEIVNQYNAFTVLDTLHVNGRLTLGENIADLGGLSIAYDAFTRTKQFKEGKKIDGFTPAQRFFLSWAQIWRNNALPQTAAQLLLVDSHAPGMHRANGPVSNMDEWYEAFNVKETDKMYKPREKRTTIW